MHGLSGNCAARQSREFRAEPVTGNEGRLSFFRLTEGWSSQMKAMHGVPHRKATGLKREWGMVDRSRHQGPSRPRDCQR